MPFPFTAGTFLATIVQLMMTIPESNYVYSKLPDNPVRFHCPWALVVGGVGSILVLISALRHLATLSNKANENVQTCQTHGGTNRDILAQHPHETLRPPDYGAAVEMKSLI